jgi:hypothetical protein
MCYSSSSTREDDDDDADDDDNEDTFLDDVDFFLELVGSYAT